MKLFAKKSLGQHFLNSPKVLAQIIETADIKKGDKVLEIGPGTGILTRSILEKEAIVMVVEKDHRACSMLNITFEKELREGRLELIEGDILETVLPSLDDKQYLLVANIPYYITGAILEKFLEYAPRPKKIVILTQKEVAERIVARDGKESILSVSVKVFGEPSIVANVPRGAFTPAPSVDSAILAIDDISDIRFTEKNITSKMFFDIVKAGFAHKRKYTIRNLETMIPPDKLKVVWQELNLNPKIRAEDVSLENWLEIAKCAL